METQQVVPAWRKYQRATFLHKREDSWSLHLGNIGKHCWPPLEMLVDRCLSLKSLPVLSCDLCKAMLHNIHVFIILYANLIQCSKPLLSVFVWIGCCAGHRRYTDKSNFIFLIIWLDWAGLKMARPLSHMGAEGWVFFLGRGIKDQLGLVAWVTGT